jgi:hypothetical protein
MDRSVSVHQSISDGSSTYHITESIALPSKEKIWFFNPDHPMKKGFHCFPFEMRLSKKAQASGVYGIQVMVNFGVQRPSACSTIESTWLSLFVVKTTASSTQRYPSRLNDLPPEDETNLKTQRRIERRLLKYNVPQSDDFVPSSLSLFTQVSAIPSESEMDATPSENNLGDANLEPFPDIPPCIEEGTFTTSESSTDTDSPFSGSATSSTWQADSSPSSSTFDDT